MNSKISLDFRFGSLNLMITFTILNGFGYFFCDYFVLETKGKSEEEVEVMFEERKYLLLRPI